MSCLINAANQMGVSVVLEQFSTGLNRFCFTSGVAIGQERCDGRCGSSSEHLGEACARRTKTQMARPVWLNFCGFRLDPRTTTAFAEPLDLEPNRHLQNDSIRSKSALNQQFDVEFEILNAGLVPIIEPEINIKIADKAEVEEILLAEITEQLNHVPTGQQVMLKLSLPMIANLDLSPINSASRSRLGHFSFEVCG